MPKKTERWDPLGFFNIFSVSKHQKLKGPIEEINFFEKKTHNAEKTERWDPLVSPGTVCYAEKQEKLLCGMVQLIIIIIRRTFEELFWSVRVD